jgi:DNA-binding CsgD family transcriptional regulator
MKSSSELNKIQSFWANMRPEIKTNEDLLYNREEVFEMVGKIFCPGPFYIYVFNFVEQTFDYVSEGIEKILGISPKEINVPKLYELAHPEDTARVLQSELVAAKFMFEEIDPSQILNYKVSYMFRLKRKDGSYANIMHQAMGLKVNDNNNFITVLGIHTDISHVVSVPEPYLSFLDIQHKNSVYHVDPYQPDFKGNQVSSTCPLTDRELELLGHLAEGKSVEKSANALNIAEGTARKHRDNIRRKLDATNTTQAVAIAIRKGWL